MNEIDPRRARALKKLSRAHRMAAEAADELLELDMPRAPRARVPAQIATSSTPDNEAAADRALAKLGLRKAG